MSARPPAEWIVLKFGGTSVSSLGNWRNIAGVVRERGAQAARVLVVHSALSGITDRLEKLLAAALAGPHGSPPVRTAVPPPTHAREALRARLESLARVVLGQGFIASNASGDAGLLGRGGSDTSGAYLAARLRASRLEIWTDVAGMFSANPRSTPAARLLRALHYDEAQEIASGGAKVLHPRCILPARQAQIPIWVYDTQTPHLEGTPIGASGGGGAAQGEGGGVKKGITLGGVGAPRGGDEGGFFGQSFRIFRRPGHAGGQG